MPELSQDDIILIVATAAAFSLVAFDASACGGFFCNAGTQSPIYQAGERVVFHQQPGTPEQPGKVTMHIEIAYQGDPTEFGWILPILGPPTDSEGTIAPLEEILAISSTKLFNTDSNI